jgi:hypothetical protein
LASPKCGRTPPWVDATFLHGAVHPVAEHSSSGDGRRRPGGPPPQPAVSRRIRAAPGNEAPAGQAACAPSPGRKSSGASALATRRPPCSSTGWTVSSSAPQPPVNEPRLRSAPPRNPTRRVWPLRLNDWTPSRNVSVERDRPRRTVESNSGSAVRRTSRARARG